MIKCSPKPSQGKTHSAASLQKNSQQSIHGKNTHNSVYGNIITKNDLIVDKTAEIKGKVDISALEVNYDTSMGKLLIISIFSIYLANLTILLPLEKYFFKK